MRLCGVRDFNGSLGAAHRCPLCKGRPRDPASGQNARARIETLKIHLNVRNEVIVRCHNCGLTGTAMELLRAHTKDTWEVIAGNLQEARVFGTDPVPEDWIERAKQWEKFSIMFEKSKAWYRRMARNGQIEEFAFGEVGMSSAAELERNLPGVKLVNRWGKGAMLTVHLHRSLLGLASHVLIRKKKTNRPVASFVFHPPEPLHLMVPDWSLYRDWSEELTVFTDLSMAGSLHEVHTKHPSGIAPPLAWIADCRGPLIDEIPCRTVRYLPGEHEGAEFALAFAQPGVEVLVGTEDAVARTADDIISRTQGRSNTIAYLHTVLQKPWITPHVANRLSEAVATRMGRSATTIIARSGATDRVLPCTIRGTTYLCRNGIYVKRQGKEDWKPCSNFSLRIEESILKKDREVAHRLLLQMNGKTANFTVLSRELQNGRLLLEQATAAAIEHGFSDLPRVMEPGDIKCLPHIVQATQLKPALCTAQPPFLGFDRGRFHGPNFTATSRGVQFRPYHSAADARWILPETPWEPQNDHLTCRANELAAWLKSLEPVDRHMASVIIHAALAWLQRGSRSLPSYLILPSELHLKLLGEITGLVPIEVGRGPKVQLGVPRLMRSSYWRPDQFEKHGRIVAAIEDLHRRTNPLIPIVLHNWTGNSVPSPPSGILALLTHCVLGTTETLSAVIRLLSLVECTELRRGIQPGLYAAAEHYADAGRYLDTFLSAARMLPDLENYMIRRRKRTYLKRTVVNRLNEECSFGFRETRLIDELRQRYPLPQPVRYGSNQIPAFRIPPEVIAPKA